MRLGHSASALLIVFSSLAACGDEPSSGEADAAGRDAQVADATIPDAGPLDGAPVDADPGILDLDDDGLDDAEEAALALRFEPYLWLSVKEEGFRADRLPHFAVEPLPPDGVTIFYALSYYEDYGDPPFGLSSHPGDSESIVVEIRPDPAGDWQLDRVFLSAHYGTLTDGSEWVPAAELEMEIDAQGQPHPVVYVAEWKHANYKSLAACDAGALSLDHCDQGSLEPVGITADRNLGGRLAPFIDEVQHLGNSEWYWTDIRFCGWQVASPDNSGRGACPGDSSTYSDFLGLWETDSF